METDEGSDEKAITAMGLLNTIETLLTVMESQPEIMAQLQPTVLQVVGHIFSQSVMGNCVVIIIITTKNMLKRGEECDTYLTHVCRYMLASKDQGENIKTESFQTNTGFHQLLLQVMKDYIIYYV